MARSALLFVVPLLALSAGRLSAQVPLTLAEVVALSKTASPAARAAAAAEREVRTRITQARAGLFPRADVSESWQWGNQPVFVFGSKLAQRRFTEADFAIAALNRPAAVNNVRTSLLVSQSVFDGGSVRAAVRTAEIQSELAGLATARTEQELAYAAVQAFSQIIEWDAAHRVAMAAVESAESDLARAGHRRDQGTATDADVLAVEVHAAEMRQRAATSDAERRIAREQLNAALGRELSAPIDVVLPDTPLASGPSGEDAEVLALATRPEVRQAALGTSLADTAVRVARAAFLPRIDAVGGWEINGSGLAHGAASWVGGIEVSVNLFRGLADRGRVLEAEEARRRQRAEREAQELSVRLEVRAALARLDSALERQRAARAAVTHAAEAQRIVRDRYEQGLATITDVLRAAEAAVQAESLASRARADVVRHGAALDRATGRL